jgi:PilZ domain-containing protein
MPDGKDRRRHKRIAVTWAGEALSGTDRFSNVEIVNISISGLGAISLSPMQRGSHYLFRFPGWTELPIAGVVRWADEGEVQSYVGIEFVSPTEKQLAALRELIARYDKEDWGGEDSAE